MREANVSYFIIYSVSAFSSIYIKLQADSWKTDGFGTAGVLLLDVMTMLKLKTILVIMENWSIQNRVFAYVTFIKNNESVIAT